jgi:helicase MOV-10
MFSSSSVDALSSQLSAMSFADSNLNEQQQSAVRSILSGRGHTAPYIIFGPPGTGKTVTIVRTIEYFFALPANANKHILVCAPSNTAADLLVERLSARFDNKNMLRLMSFMRNPNDVTPLVKKYCRGEWII